MRTLLPALLIASLCMLSGCDLICCDSEPELTEKQARIKSLSEGTWYHSLNNNVPVGEDPNIFDSLVMVFGSDSEYEPTYFKVQNFPVFETNDYSTWDLVGLNYVSCRIDDTGDFSFAISNFTDTAMAISFTWINPNTGENDCPEGLAGCPGDDYGIELYR